jgi:hypothetical protein
MVITIEQSVQVERLCLSSWYAHPFDSVLAFIHEDLVKRLVAQCWVVANRQRLAYQSPYNGWRPRQRPADGPMLSDMCSLLTYIWYRVSGLSDPYYPSANPSSPSTLIHVTQRL